MYYKRFETNKIIQCYLHIITCLLLTVFGLIEKATAKIAAFQICVNQFCGGGSPVYSGG